MEEESIQRAAQLLLNGATMLHIKCPNCKDPIYELRDQSFTCATCNQEVIFQSEEFEQDDQSQITHADPIQNKIDILSQQLDKANDPDEILKLAALIKKLQKLK